MKSEPRDHQKLAKSLIAQSLSEGKRRPVLMAPTGAGKTLIAAIVVANALRQGKRVLFMVPRQDLVGQTLKAFWNEGIRDLGCIHGSALNTIYRMDDGNGPWVMGDENAVREDRSKPVQVASVQTLMRRELPDFDVGIIDECHLIFKWYWRTFGLLADPNHDKRVFIGLSATPWSRGMGKFFDNLLTPTDTQTLIAQEYLSPFKVWAPTHPDLSGVKVVAGDYHESQLSKAMQEGKLVADAVTTWHEHGEPTKTIVFAVDRAHAKKLQSQFHQAGYDFEYVDGETSREDRMEIKRKFHAEEVSGIVNVDVMTMGVDWDVRCIVLCRPTKSIIRHVQAIGRGLRTAEGKKELLILDHSDTHLRLGFVTDIHKDHLDDGKDRTKADTPVKPERLPKDCKKCGALMTPGLACQACGFVPEPKESMVTHVHGQLGLLGDEAGTLVQKKATKIDKQEWWSGFLQLAYKRGYRQGWAAHCYKDKFEVWPRGLIDVPAEPPQAMYGWLKHREIRDRKRRENQERQRMADKYGFPMRQP